MKLLRLKIERIRRVIVNVATRPTGGDRGLPLWLFQSCEPPTILYGDGADLQPDQAEENGATKMHESFHWSEIMFPLITHQK